MQTVGVIRVFLSFYVSAAYVVFKVLSVKSCCKRDVVLNVFLDNVIV